MTLLEIQDARAKCLEENDRIFAEAGSAERNMNEKEEDAVNANLRKLRELDLKELTLKYRDEPGVEVKAPQKRSEKQESFSLIKMINNVVNHRQQDDHVKDLFNIAKKEMRHAGVDCTGSIVIPSQRAIIEAGEEGMGQEIVAEDKRAILPPLENRLVLVQAGATYLKGLVGNVAIPSYSGTSVDWKNETGQSHDGAGNFSEVLFSPKRLTAYIDVSKLFLAQDGVGAERLLLDNIAGAVTRKLESTILGVAEGLSTRPQGIFYFIAEGKAGVGTGAVEATWSNVVAMETAVDTANALQQNLGYMTNSAGRGLLKSSPKGSASDDIMLMEGNTMNGYPVYVTNSCAATVGYDDTGSPLIFGNWADLLIAQWGGYDITVDPYTEARNGYIRIVINAYFDAKGLRGATTDNDYAVSFNRKAIEAQGD